MTTLQTQIVEHHQKNPALSQTELAVFFGVERKDVNEAIRLKAVEIATARQPFRMKDSKKVIVK